MPSAPLDANAAFRAGQQAVAAGRLEEARAHFRAAAEANGHPDALLHLSYLGSKDGRYREPLELALRVFEQSPRSLPQAIQLLSRLRNFNQSWAIRAFIDRSPFLLEATDPRALHAVAVQLSYIGDAAGAVRFLDRALRFHAGAPPLLLARAQNLVILGRFDDARRDLQDCLQRAPGMGPAWWTLAQLPGREAVPGRVDAIRRQLAAAREPIERAYLGYALHKELDDAGDIAGACEALTLANQAMRPTVPYDDAANEALAAELMATDFDRIPAAPETDAGFTPVFIVGMFRSGTTLLEQLLGANPAVIGAGELFDLPASLRYATDLPGPAHLDAEIVRRAPGADFAEVAALYARGVRWRAGGHSHVTDKLPPNFWNIGYLCKAFPQARILHMARDPVETCFSNLRELFSGGAGQYSYDQAELAAYHRRYERLMAFWHRQFPGRIQDVHYARLTTDTEAVMREVAAHLGIDFLPGMVDPRSNRAGVATASLVQVRQPVTARKVAKWEPYRDYLQPLIRGLGDPTRP